MMQKEFSELAEAKEKINEGLSELHKTLYELFQRTDKSFSIIFKGKKYDFQPATTEEESIRKHYLSKRFIKKLLLYTLDKDIKCRYKSSGYRYEWDDILSFASGPDPKDFQYEKISVDQLYEINDENGEKISSLPLNLDSSYVKSQDSRNDQKRDNLE